MTVSRPVIGQLMQNTVLSLVGSEFLTSLPLAFVD